MLCDKDKEIDSVLQEVDALMTEAKQIVQNMNKTSVESVDNAHREALKILGLKINFKLASMK